MKRLFLLSLIIPVLATAQIPNWYDLNSRNAAYPQSAYYTGVGTASVINGNVNTALISAQNAARVEALSSIRVHVENVTTDLSSSQQLITNDGMSETILEQLDSKTRTSIDIDVPGLQVETYRNGNEVAAFAYVKRQTLLRQLDKSITVGLTKIESQLDNADELINQGQKMEAREQIKSLPKIFAEVSRDQKLLAVVDSESDAETLQLNESKTLQQRYIQMLASLKHGINIYLNCQADLFGNNYPTLANTIKGELSKIGCSFVTSASEADWAINVTANAREYNAPTMGGYTTYFAYIDATLAIDKKVTNQRIYEDALTEKGGHTHNYTEAARDGYKQIAPKIIELINQYIKQ